MSNFYVSVAEVHYSTYAVEADSHEEAARLVDEGAGVSVDMEYSHVLSTGYRMVRNVDDNTKAIRVEIDDD